MRSRYGLRAGHAVCRTVDIPCAPCRAVRSRPWSRWRSPCRWVSAHSPHLPRQKASLSARAPRRRRRRLPRVRRAVGARPGRADPRTARPAGGGVRRAGRRAAGRGAPGCGPRPRRSTRSPNGQMVAELNSSPIRTRAEDGTWQKIDTDLSAGEDGLLRPAATPVPARCSQRVGRAENSRGWSRAERRSASSRPRTSRPRRSTAPRRPTRTSGPVWTCRWSPTPTASRRASWCRTAPPPRR